MEATTTKNFINAATAAETENAKKNWGPTFYSEHEAWAVLKEEVEEAAEEEKTIQDCLNALWNAIRQGKQQERQKNSLSFVFQHAQALATEAVQIAAVAQKYLDTLEGTNGPAE